MKKIEIDLYIDLNDKFGDLLNESLKTTIIRNNMLFAREFSVKLGNELRWELNGELNLILDI
jgi:hypothetical protein